MRGLMHLLTALTVFALAFWAYRENYATQEMLAETQSLQRQIGTAQVRLGVLRAEWAYLNRPQRLRELADTNFERLGLLPLTAEQFGRVDEVIYPLPSDPGATLPLGPGAADAAIEASLRLDTPRATPARTQPRPQAGGRSEARAQPPTPPRADPLTDPVVAPRLAAPAPTAAAPAPVAPGRARQTLGRDR